MPSRRKIAPTPPVSAARSVSVRMRNLSWAVNVRRRGRLESSGDAADGAGTTVGLRKPTVAAPPAGLIGFGSMGMSEMILLRPQVKYSRAKMSHFHWHGGPRLGARGVEHPGTQHAELELADA